MNKLTREIQITVRVTKKQHEKLKNIANFNDLSISELVRRHLENVFNI